MCVCVCVCVCVLARARARLHVCVCVRVCMYAPVCLSLSYALLSMYTFVHTLGCALARTDLVFIVDASTSVTESNFRKVLSFIQDFVRTADIDSGNVRIAVALYSTDVRSLGGETNRGLRLFVVDRLWWCDRSGRDFAWFGTV